MLRLPDEIRPLLKPPLGELFADVKRVVERLQHLHPRRLIAVGDVVAAELLAAGVKPDVAVIDFKVMRAPVSEKIRRALEAHGVRTLRVKNPAGTLTLELREAFNAEPPLKIVVEGEEDLATLPAVLSAPLGSVVVYGQPGEGIVLIEVTEQKKHEFGELLKRFKSA